MEHIWAPWRIEYVLQEKTEGCIFCDKPKEARDSDNLILYRGQKNFLMLNSYPYNPGHCMVAPYHHIAHLDELSAEELAEHFEIVTKSIKTLREVLHPDAFNIGINMGKSAGAGVEGHVHTHIVPRWEGDTSFMTVVAETKVIPEALAATYAKLKDKIA